MQCGWVFAFVFEFNHCFQGVASVIVGNEGSGEDSQIGCGDDYYFVIFVQNLHNRPFAVMESYQEANLWSFDDVEHNPS